MINVFHAASNTLPYPLNLQIIIADCMEKSKSLLYKNLVCFTAKIYKM